MVRRPHIGAFTLVELLVVLGIIALLIALLLPTLTRVRQQAAMTRCASNVRQILMTTQMHANVNGQVLPRARNFPWQQGPNHGNLWPGAPYIQDLLKEYLESKDPDDVSEVWKCPGLGGDKPASTDPDQQQETDYRYNVPYAAGKSSGNAVDATAAMLYLDQIFPEWKVKQYPHRIGAGGGSINVGYLDGHVAPLSYERISKDNLYPTGMEDKDAPLFSRGWQ